MKIVDLAFILLSVTCVYSKKLHNIKKSECGRVELDTHRIINGYISVANRWPWHVGLFLKFNNQYNFFCGGSLISNTHVLTAAHCFDKIPSFLEIYIGTGLFNLSDAKPGVNLFKVSRKIKHEKYNKEDYFANDIALLELSKPVITSKKVSTICLPSSYDTKIAYNKTLRVAGWGSTKQKVSQDSISNSLMEVKIEIINFFNETLCQNMDELKYCGYDFSQKHSNLCVGDSGGSLMHFMNGKWYVFGVVSFGNVEFDQNNTEIKCQNDLPTYFTIIPRYIDWIYTKLDLLNKQKH